MNQRNLYFSCYCIHFCSVFILVYWVIIHFGVSGIIFKSLQGRERSLVFGLLLFIVIDSDGCFRLILFFVGERGCSFGVWGRWCLLLCLLASSREKVVEFALTKWWNWVCLFIFYFVIYIYAGIYINS